MFRLEEVVPWGRSFDEYRRMFALTDADLRSRILGCGDGPASFNAEATSRGARVVSFDPIYRWTADQITGRIAATYDQVMEQARQNADRFVWSDSIPSVEQLGRLRMTAMNTFLADYRNRTHGRYVAGALPAIPFSTNSFDLAVSSHLLLLYSEHLGEAFHRAAVRDMCRVATESRIFPLLTLDGQRSPYVDAIVSEFAAAGCEVSIERVDYEFQRGGNEMVRARRSANANS